MDKSPLTTNGHLDASTDPNKVRELFQFHDECLIGARMGKDSQLFACDFDLYKPGAREYMEELADKGLLTDTQTHITRSGGVHLIYRSDSDYPNCKPHDGVEVKGEGGYIIVPPSPGYKIEKEGISYAPPALIAELLKARKQASQSTVDALKAKVLSGADFHDSLAALAARRSAQGWDQAKVQKEVIDTLSASVASNKNHARHDRWKSLMEDRGGELSRIVSSGHQKYNPHVTTDKARENVQQEQILGMAKASASFFGERDPFAPKYDEAPAGVEDQIKKLLPQEGELIDEWPFANEGYFANQEREILNQRYVMYPLMAERETVLMAAEPKAGKTAISLRMAIAISQGESLGTALQVAEKRPVLYFTLEGARAVEMRIAAERGRRRDSGLEWPSDDCLFIVDRPQNLLDNAYQLAFAAKIIAHDRKCKQVHGASLGAVFIDTFTKAMPGGDQNSVEDTSQLFKITDLLRANGIVATIVWIHHLSKQGEVRGSTNIEAEVDVVSSVEKTKTPGIVRLLIRRARSLDETANYMFRLTSYFLGETVQGHKLHAPVVDMVDLQEANPTTTVGGDAREADKWARVCRHLIETLGEGFHHVEKVYTALAAKGYVPAIATRRPILMKEAPQKALDEVFGGKHTWAFGDHWLSLTRDPKTNWIAALEIKVVK